MGQQVGSMQNLLATQSTQSYAETPKVGDGVTLVGWTDRASATVIRVYPSGNMIDVQEDHVEYNYPSGSAKLIAPDTDGKIITVRRRTRGKHTGQWYGDGMVAMIGVRDPHFDYEF